MLTVTGPKALWEKRNARGTRATEVRQHEQRFLPNVLYRILNEKNWVRG